MENKNSCKVQPNELLCYLSTVVTGWTFVNKHANRHFVRTTILIIPPSTVSTIYLQDASQGDQGAYNMHGPLPVLIIHNEYSSLIHSAS